MFLLSSHLTYLTPEQEERFICPQPVSVRAGAQKCVELRLLDFHLGGGGSYKHLVYSDVLLTVHLSIILVINQLDAQNLLLK